MWRSQIEAGKNSLMTIGKTYERVWTTSLARVSEQLKEVS